MEKIENINLEKVFIKQYDYVDDKAVGYINNTKTLYCIDRKKKMAYKIPEKYQETPIVIYHQCGGVDDSGKIMVSLLGKINLSYYHDLSDIAGIWGWIDLEGNEIISPKYTYAMAFCDKYAIVCKGDWTIDGEGKYWCYNEKWGVIDINENEVVPCIYDDEIRFISENLVAVKDGRFEKGKWKDGNWRLYDIKQQKEIFKTRYSLRYSTYKAGYLTIYREKTDRNSEVIVYDFIENKYLFIDKGYEEIEIIGRNKFNKI